jgi:hypothetical protein
MDLEELRHHIELASPHCGYQARQLTSQIVASCWPGGPADRVDRAALDWVALWHPDLTGAALPACSCTAGHCGVCN